MVAGIAKRSGALTVAIVTKPFAFEGRRRMQQAVDAINELKKNVDTVIIVSNNKLLEIIPDDTPVTAAFRVADDILRQGVVGISEIIVRPGLINVDFADVRSVMKDAGNALMGIGTGTGKYVPVLFDYELGLPLAMGVSPCRFPVTGRAPKTQRLPPSARRCSTNP